ncbi:MAG: hypothetical protein JG781_2239 [Peptococcaceae bacterium]|nr:hypothetical protein [Peptococcaceae bacterium]
MKQQGDALYYLMMETKVSHILEQIEELKNMLIHCADAQMQYNDGPLCHIEETIAHVQHVKEQLNKLDISFCHDCEAIAS